MARNRVTPEQIRQDSAEHMTCQECGSGMVLTPERGRVCERFGCGPMLTAGYRRKIREPWPGAPDHQCDWISVGAADLAEAWPERVLTHLHSQRERKALMRGLFRRADR